MELNKKQKEGLELAVTRYINKEKITVIAGYAATGKSTLVNLLLRFYDQIENLHGHVDFFHDRAAAHRLADARVL